MITEAKYPNEPRELWGLSGDPKPTGSLYLGQPLTNGSVFIEMDTGSVYLFDRAAGAWVRL